MHDFCIYIFAKGENKNIPCPFLYELKKEIVQFRDGVGRNID
jgi:hypothetical protein